MNLQQIKVEWVDTPQHHAHIHELFKSLVDADPILEVHRNYVQEQIWGFGERSFWYLWKLIINELSDDANLLEIGCFRGATLSLWRLLANDRISCNIFGVTPLNTAGGMWESDYRSDIKKIHDDFDLLLKYKLFVGYSQDKEIIEQVDEECEEGYDVIYIDGSHEYEDAVADFNNYAPMVKPGGYLVVDDCNNDLNFPPTGFFCGIDSVTEAKKEWLKTQTDFVFVANVVHISVFQRK